MFDSVNVLATGEYHVQAFVITNYQKMHLHTFVIDIFYSKVSMMFIWHFQHWIDLPSLLINVMEIHFH